MVNDNNTPQHDILLNEKRLEKLRSLRLLDSEPEPAFDRLTRLASDILDVPVSLISLLDSNRQFFKSQVGLPEPWASQRETPLSHSFCQHVVRTGESLVIEDARENDLVRENLAIRDLNVIAYAGIPLKTSDGFTLGSLCAIDSKVKQWTERDIRILTDLAASVMTEIELRNELYLHQQTEKQLRASEMKFKKVAESANDAIIVLDETASIQFVNDKACEVFGYTKDELFNIPIDTLTQTPDTPQLQVFSMSDYTSSSTSSNFESMRLVGQHRDGNQIPIEITLGQFLEGDQNWVTLVIREITDRMELEHELRANEARYLQILDAIPDLVFVKDRQSHLVWANNALQEYYGLSLGDMIGMIDAEHVDENITDAYLATDQKVFEEGVRHMIDNEPIMQHDGVVNYFRTTKTPIFDDDGNVMLLVGISRDITDSKLIEKHLMDALEEKEKLIELKSSFTSMVSHEFRTPLAVILSSTEILMNYFDRLTDERREGKLTTIKAQVKHLTHLMDDILMLSRGEKMSLPFNPAMRDIHALTFSIVEDVRVTYASSQVAIDYQKSGSCELVYVDDNLIRQIFQNLLSNAIKYSKTQGEVKLRLMCDENELTLIVSDDGIGIPAENQANLYQTFHRANNVGTIQGTGLGLAIVKRAVDAHGGTIDFKSIVNQGTMFIVKLPVKQVQGGIDDNTNFSN